MKLTDEQWWAISDYASQPIPLRDADLTRPFLYVRGYGVFYIDMGCHQLVSALIYTWMQGKPDIFDLVDEGVLEATSCYEVAATRLTELDGVASLSNVGRDIIYASKLNYAEKTYIKEYESYIH